MPTPDDSRPDLSKVARASWLIVSILLGIVGIDLGFDSLLSGAEPLLATVQIICGMAVVTVFGRALIRANRRPVDPQRTRQPPELDGDGARDRKIRIIKTPRGAAPEWVREAWVGLVLPLGDHPAGDPRLLRRFGVTSFWRKRLFPWTAARYEPADFFPVFANKAIAVLQKTQPDAAWWWTENTPHLLHPTARLIFRRDECELES